MTTTPALLVAAAGVAFGHAVLPDHWIPLAVLSRTRRYPMRRIARLSLLAGITHVLLSILLGAAVIVVGLQFRHTVQRHEDLVVGGLLLLTGVVLLGMQLIGRDHDHDHRVRGDARPGASRTRQVAAFVVPFGAAASPDLTILPVFLAASSVGAVAALGTLIAFGTVTIATIVVATMLAAAGAQQLQARWIDQSANLITAGALVGIGGLITAGVL